MASDLMPQGNPEHPNELARILSRGYLRLVLGQAGKSSERVPGGYSGKGLDEFPTESVHGFHATGKEGKTP